MHLNNHTPECSDGIILQAHWIGRFGNRMFSYLFGRHYAEKFNLQFWIPSEWEGSVLFEDSCSKVVEDDLLRLRLNQTNRELDTIEYRSWAIGEFGRRYGIPFKQINPNNPAHYGRENVFYDNLCVNSNHIFENYTRQYILALFEWSDQVRSSDLFRQMEDAQGSYDIAHLRRDDIANGDRNAVNFCNYSVVSKSSYDRAFEKFDVGPEGVQWVTDDRKDNWGIPKQASKFAGWTYPQGSHRIPNIFFDWLPDFLRIYFARRVFRANSSFSWWAAYLNPLQQIYSPVISTTKPYLDSGDELDVDFVEGNTPHWFHPMDSPWLKEINIPSSQ